MESRNTIVRRQRHLPNVLTGAALLGVTLSLSACGGDEQAPDRNNVRSQVITPLAPATSEPVQPSTEAPAPQSPDAPASSTTEAPASPVPEPSKVPVQTSIPFPFPGSSESDGSRKICHENNIGAICNADRAGTYSLVWRGKIVDIEQAEAGDTVVLAPEGAVTAACRAFSVIYRQDEAQAQDELVATYDPCD